MKSTRFFGLVEQEERKIASDFAQDLAEILEAEEKKAAGKMKRENLEVEILRKKKILEEILSKLPGAVFKAVIDGKKKVHVYLEPTSEPRDPVCINPGDNDFDMVLLHCPDLIQEGIARWALIRGLSLSIKGTCTCDCMGPSGNKPCHYCNGKTLIGYSIGENGNTRYGIIEIRIPDSRSLRERLNFS